MYRTTAFLPSEKKTPKVNFTFWYGHGFATRSLVPNTAAVPNEYLFRCRWFFAFSNLEELG
jgi:hypothetical protein